MTVHPNVVAVLDAMPPRPEPGTPITEQRESQRRWSEEIRRGRAFAEPARLVDTAVPTAGAAVPVRVYVPPGAGPHPLLMHFHGGGFRMGDVDLVDPVCRDHCVAGGCVVVSVDYRLAPEHPFPAGLEDCWAATAWAAENAGELHADPRRLAVSGASAGGNLAAVVAQRARASGGPEISFQLLEVPVTDATATYAPDPELSPTGPALTADAIAEIWDDYVPDPSRRSDPWVSPLLAPSLAGLPPALIVTAEHDPLRAEGVAYAAHLRAAGVPVEHVDVAGAVHGLQTVAGLSPETTAAHDRVIAALRKLSVGGR